MTPMLTFGAATDLDGLKWKKRVIVLLSASPTDARLLTQKEKLASQRSPMAERDVVVLEETSAQGPLHRRFSVRDDFSALLIGKDGGEKWRTSDIFLPQIVFDQIDQMPMRAREMKK